MKSRKQSRARVGFAPRIAGAMSILILSTCTVLSAVVVRQTMNRLRQVLFDQGRSLAVQLANNSELAMLSGDVERLAALAREVRTHPDVSYAGFIDSQGRVLAVEGGKIRPDLASNSRSRPLEGPVEVASELWEFRAPVLTAAAAGHREELGFGSEEAAANESLGSVVVAVSGASIDNLQARVLMTVALVTLLVVIFSMIVATALASRLAWPLRELTRAAEKIAAGDLGARAPESAIAEVSTLARAFNVMAETVENSDRRYRTNANARSEAEPGSRVQRASDAS